MWSQVLRHFSTQMNLERQASQLVYEIIKGNKDWITLSDIYSVCSNIIVDNYLKFSWVDVKFTFYS